MQRATSDIDAVSRLVVRSPVGPLELTARRGALVGVAFVTDATTGGAQADPPGRDPGSARHTEDDDVLAEAARQLDEYFAGGRREFDLPLRPAGSPFQLEVWDALGHIPYGETRTYGELARAVGRPSAARAVGGANHVNPLAIVVPCHRVIGADGTLTGYGGGLATKEALLRLESGARPLDGFERTRP